MRLFPSLLWLFARNPQDRARARARMALWLVRLAARLDVQVVVVAASAITALAELNVAEALAREADRETAPRLN